MTKLILVPAAISSLRIVALPLFFYLFTQVNVASCLILLAFSAATDYFDGFAARRLKATTRFGAYYDALTDFMLMLGIFVIFYFQGYYTLWLPMLIAVSFVQFIATGRYVKKIYDPVGRYIGSALYIGVVLTLLWPTQTVFAFVQYAFVVFFLVSLVSRAISLAKRQN